ncbi:MAG: methionine--tRNA ligase [Candidatus Celaenobacter polaris]|nr:methionine--tRNA ligase [Candidatus Celaenobacter polaris]
MKREKYLVTSALPYANGHLHIGHVAGAYLPADIFVRFQKLLGNDVIYICGTDEYGAPISIKAEAEGKTPREIVDHYHDSIVKSFHDLEINFDNFSGTARPEHTRISQKFFLNLLNAGYVLQKTTQQLYCDHDKRFLADRYIEGTCPYCGAKGARGDQCDTCGKLIDAIKLIDPKCKICGNTPVVKETTNWYLELPKFEKPLREWLKTKTYWKENVLNFILSWLNEGLIERSITRDLGWGIPVPLDDAEGKVLYVWFDAPIGYLSSTVEWAKNLGTPERWKDYWLDPNTKLIHFLGKDNIPFHTIIWPSVLMEQEKKYVLPYDVPANEYLNIKGRKTSTSRNYAIWIRDFVKYFEPEFLRYYLAANAPETKDSDFSWEDFQSKINNELANILGNLANRVFTFVKKYFNGKIEKPQNLSQLSENTLDEAYKLVNEIKECYANYRVRKAVKLIMDIARSGNKYFDETKPWFSVKDDKAAASETLYVCTELLRIISIVFSPVLPKAMRKLRTMMDLNTPLNWNEIDNSITKTTLGTIEPLFRKITDKEVKEQNELLEKQYGVAPALEHKPEIDYDDFTKIELRVVKVIAAETIPKAKKLLKLKVDCAGEIRQVIAGISQYYKPEDLVGRQIVLLMNLKPRKFMGLESQGMILAANSKEGIAVVVPEKEVPEGSEVL